MKRTPIHKLIDVGNHSHDTLRTLSAMFLAVALVITLGTAIAAAVVAAIAWLLLVHWTLGVAAIVAVLVVWYRYAVGGAQ